LRTISAAARWDQCRWRKCLLPTAGEDAQAADALGHGHGGKTIIAVAMVKVLIVDGKAC